MKYIKKAIIALIVFQIISAMLAVLEWKSNAEVTIKILTEKNALLEAKIEALEAIKNDHVKYLGKFEITAYCDCVECQEQWVGQTASGKRPQANHTIAVDPKVIPLGTRIIIDGQEYIAEDTGGMIKGNKIDIFFATHEETVKFGRQHKDIYIILEREK